MEEFRAGDIGRFAATSAILSVLGDCDVSDEEKEKTVTLLLQEIGSRQPKDSTPPTHASTSTARKDARPQSPTEREKHREEVDNLFERLSKRSEPDEVDPDAGLPRKRRVREEDMPWFGKSNAERRPSCIATCKLLQRFNDDLSGSRNLLRIAAGQPEGIPSSQWDRILKGEPIKLNHILSAMHCLSVNEERRGRLGEHDIIVGVPEAKRQIRTSSEWSSAFWRAARAIAFVYPHRQEELSEYAEYVEREFAAKQASAHSRIIAYDIAIRNQVGGGQNVLLTDTHCFTHLYSAIVMSDGVEFNSVNGSNGKRNGGGNPKKGKSGSGGNPSNGSDGAKTEICNKFNNQSGCTFTEESCKYKHCCKGCGESGHGKLQCPKI